MPRWWCVYDYADTQQYYWLCLERNEWRPYDRIVSRHPSDGSRKVAFARMPSCCADGEHVLFEYERKAFCLRHTRYVPFRELTGLYLTGYDIRIYYQIEKNDSIETSWLDSCQ